MLARSLSNYVNLFDLDIVTKELLPMFIQFADDRNTQVSEAVAPALAPILMKYSGRDVAQQRSIIKIVRNNFRHGTYKRRQLYILMANDVMNQSKELFEEYFKHDYLSLVGDRTSNVRIVLARSLAAHFTVMGAFAFDPLVNHCVRLLKADRISDVHDHVSSIQLLQNKKGDSEDAGNDGSSVSSHTSDFSASSAINDQMDVASFLDHLQRHRTSEVSNNSQKKEEIDDTPNVKD